LKTAVIIPVKTFSNSKTRLQLSAIKTKVLCKLLLREVVKTVTNSELVNEIIVVTNEKEITDIIEEFNCKKIIDYEETGVNDAIRLTEEYLLENNFTHSIVLPLDVPFFHSEEIDVILRQMTPNSVMIIPSRHFDGTNALIRTPINVMTTRYDEGSHKPQIESARKQKIKISIGLVRKLMLDIDNLEDIEYCLKQDIKPELCAEMEKIMKNE
tara:strand:- start:459 stop:1094 length:636 start_codon:yes stop_codon:yes gene_type:complete